MMIEEWEKVDGGEPVLVRSYESSDSPAVDPADPTHSVDDPLAAEVAGLRAVVEALLDALGGA